MGGTGIRQGRAINTPPPWSRSDLYRLFVAVRQYLVVFVSPARHNMEFLSASGGHPKNTNFVRERLTPPRRGDTKQVVSQILSGRRRAPFSGGSYNFGIFGNNCLNCYKMSSDLVIQTHQQLTIFKITGIFERIFGSHDEIPGVTICPARFARGKLDGTHTRRLITRFFVFALFIIAWYMQLI